MYSHSIRRTLAQSNADFLHTAVLTQQQSCSKQQYSASLVVASNQRPSRARKLCFQASSRFRALTRNAVYLLVLALATAAAPTSAPDDDDHRGSSVESIVVVFATAASDKRRWSWQLCGEPYGGYLSRVSGVCSSLDVPDESQLCRAYAIRGS